MTASRAHLPNGRHHWQHGPIDIVAEAEGASDAVAAAHDAAWQRFQSILRELVAELPLLRQPVQVGPNPLRGPIARRMWDACAPFAPEFVTPMAAVAGSVAQELIALYQRPGITRAWLNNGGDLALHLAPGARVRSGVVGDLQSYAFDSERTGQLAGLFDISFETPVRGIATSGWRGRSLSMGIADSVTVLAATAAQADAAATIIANAVNAQHPAIVRQPANQCRDNSDLGERLVTMDVPRLPADVVQAALEAGAATAHVLQQRGLIWAALMVCQEQARRVEPLCFALESQVIAGAVTASRTIEPCPI